MFVAYIGLSEPCGLASAIKSTNMLKRNFKKISRGLGKIKGKDSLGNPIFLFQVGVKVSPKIEILNKVKAIISSSRIDWYIGC